MAVHSLQMAEQALRKCRALVVGHEGGDFSQTLFAAWKSLGLLVLDHLQPMLELAQELV